MFLFRWWKGYFLTNPWDYSYEDEELDEQDKVAHIALCRYMESFNLAQWVTRVGEPEVDEQGESLWEARAINSKGLLS